MRPRLGATRRTTSSAISANKRFGQKTLQLRTDSIYPRSTPVFPALYSTKPLPSFLPADFWQEVFILEQGILRFDPRFVLCFTRRKTWPLLTFATATSAKGRFVCAAASKGEEASSRFHRSLNLIGPLIANGVKAYLLLLKISIPRDIFACSARKAIKFHRE